MINIIGKNIKKNTEQVLSKEKTEPLYTEKIPFLPIGLKLFEDNIPIFQVIGYEEKCIHSHIYTLPKLKTLVDIEERAYKLTEVRAGYSLGIITLSDKGYIGEREDMSGQIIDEMIKNTLPICFTASYILPDNPLRLMALVSKLAYEFQYDVIISTGGTGIAPSDLTPEAIIPLLTRRFYGFEQAMMAASMTKTPNALISRAFAGTLEKTFYLALQGSPKAVKENLEVVLPALPHALSKLHGDTSDCAQIV